MPRGLPASSSCNRMRRLIDGHNDVLSHLHEEGAGDAALLREGSASITVPSAREGDSRPGCSRCCRRPAAFATERTSGGYDVPPFPRCRGRSRRAVGALGARLFRLLRVRRARAAGARRRRPRRMPGGRRARRDLHLEGAEPIDPELEALEVWHAAGLRSVGPVWSRPNAFGHGVPFRFPRCPTPARPHAGRRGAGPPLRRARDRRRPQPPQRGRVLGRRAHARRAADRLALRRPPVPIDPQPDRRPARRDRGLRRPGRDQLRRRLAARRRRRRQRHAGGAHRRARALRGRRCGPTTSRSAPTSTARRCRTRCPTPPRSRACSPPSRPLASRTASSTGSPTATGVAC